MGTGTTGISSSKSSCGENGTFSSNSVNGTVRDVHADNSLTLVSVHNQIHGEILHEEITVISERSSEKSMKHRMSCSIGDSATSESLPSFSIMKGLSSESSLVDESLFGSGKWHSVGFEFQDCFRCFLAHVVDGVLVSKPVGSFDGVVSVPFPGVFGHVSECCVDSSLSCHCMGSGREEFCDAGGFETKGRKSEGGSESRTSSSYYDCVVLVVDNGVFICDIEVLFGFCQSEGLICGF